MYRIADVFHAHRETHSIHVEGQLHLRWPIDIVSQSLRYMVLYPSMLFVGTVVHDFRVDTALTVDHLDQAI